MKSSYIIKLHKDIKDLKALLQEVLDTVKTNAMDPTPIEEPNPDGPWLPAGLVVKIHEALDGK